MSDFLLEPHHTALVGMTGCGKTTFVNRLLLNDDAAACRFIFDDMNRMAPRLKIPLRFTREHLEASLETRWSAFHPQKLAAHFNGDPKKVFRWWCQWVFSVATRGPGKKIVCIPEVWRWCNEDTIPMELAALCQAGRELGIEVVFDTQNPEKLNSSLIGACTEIVVFRLLDGNSVKAVRQMLTLAGIQADASLLCQQPMGSFVGFNRQSGSRLAARFDFTTGDVLAV